MLVLFSCLIVAEAESSGEEDVCKIPFVFQGNGMIRGLDADSVSLEQGYLTHVQYAANVGLNLERILIDPRLPEHNKTRWITSFFILYNDAFEETVIPTNEREVCEKYAFSKGSSFREPLSSPQNTVRLGLADEIYDDDQLKEFMKKPNPYNQTQIPYRYNSVLRCDGFCEHCASKKISTKPITLKDLDIKYLDYKKFKLITSAELEMSVGAADGSVKVFRETTKNPINIFPSYYRENLDPVTVSDTPTQLELVIDRMMSAKYEFLGTLPGDNRYESVRLFVGFSNFNFTGILVGSQLRAPYNQFQILRTIRNLTPVSFDEFQPGFKMRVTSNLPPANSSELMVFQPKPSYVETDKWLTGPLDLKVVYK